MKSEPELQQRMYVVDYFFHTYLVAISSDRAHFFDTGISTAVYHVGLMFEQRKTASATSI